MNPSMSDYSVQRSYIEQVADEILKENLEPKECLRAIIFSEIYMMEIMSSWYYFCFMELKGLSKEQQSFALDNELRSEEILISIIRDGVSASQFICESPDLLASQVVAQLQQWHLKQWKFKLREVETEEYARFVFSSLLKCLSVDE